MSKIVLDLDRKDVSVEDFTDAFTAQIKLVQEVMREMGVPTSEVRWVIDDLRSGSAYATAKPQILGKNAFMADVDEAINATGAGLRKLERSRERPKHFSDEALKISRRLVDVVQASSAGKARMRFGQSTVTPSPKTTAHLHQIISGDIPSIGSLDGQLVGVAGTDGDYRFSIKDRFRNRRIPCFFRGAELLGEVLGNYEKRVIVRGKIFSREDGTPLRIEVRSFEVVPSDEELPTAQDVRGILSGLRRADGE